MAKVLLKKSSVAGNAPTSLDYGEVALNYADGKLYYKNSSNIIKNFIDSAGTVTAARNSISVTDNNGDGSLSYSPSTGVITYTGPSATEVRSHFSAGTGIDITSGVISVDSAGLSTYYSKVINHDSTSGFVANEHINHANVTLTAGNGLTGGGDITANRSFAVGAGAGIKVSADEVSIDSSEVVYYQTPIRALFSAGGDLSYNDSTGQFSFSETYSTANELLTAIKTVDGSTSGLDADLLDGQHGSYYRIDVYDASGTLLN